MPAMRGRFHIQRLQRGKRRARSNNLRRTRRWSIGSQRGKEKIHRRGRHRGTGTIHDALRIVSAIPFRI